MRNTPLFISLFLLIVIYTSCNKISESIEQDIIVNDTVYFDIPILSNITNGTTVTGSTPSGNIEKEISKNLNNFTTANIKSTKITSLNMALGLISKDSIDAKNNFGNLETIKIGISADGNSVNMANTSISSATTSGFLSLTPTILPDILKPFLISHSRTYDVIVKAKTITTTPMKVMATARYTITVSK